MDWSLAGTSTAARSRPSGGATAVADVAAAAEPSAAVCGRPSGVSAPTALGSAD